MSYSALAWLGFAVITLLVVLTTDMRYKSIFTKRPEHEVPRAKAAWDTMIVAVTLIMILPALELPQIFSGNTLNWKLGIGLLFLGEIDFRVRLMLGKREDATE